jgi:hypothetical protein
VADAMIFLRNVFNLSFIRLGRVFSNRSGGRTEATNVTEENSVRAYGLAFCPLMEQELTLWRFIHLRNFFAYFLAHVLLCCFMIRSRPINDSSPQGRLR